MKKTLLAASIVAAFSAPAFAESAFDGPYVGLSAGLLNNSVSISDIPIGDTSIGKAGQFGGHVLAGYSYNFEKTFNVAANVFYTFGSKTVGNALGSPIHLKNVWGLSVEPGIYLADKTLAYVKLGVANGKLGAGDDETNVIGGLYGLGLKHMVTSNVFVGAEFYKIDFRKPTSEPISMKPVQTYSGVTVGYKF